MGTLTVLEVWMLSVVILGLSAQHTDLKSLSYTDMTPDAKILPYAPAEIIGDSYESLMGMTTDHSGQVCSTWGNFHFNTFDGQFFHLPHTCNYILTTMCDSVMSDFKIQLRRTYNNDIITSTFILELQEDVITLLNDNITINKIQTTIPINQQGVRIERSTDYIRIRSSKLGLTVFWDKQNSLWIEIDIKYSGQICGLCGNFNGIKDDDLTTEGEELTPQKYGLKWKMDAITETCEQIELYSQECNIQRTKCEEYFFNEAFSDCHNLLPTEGFVDACVKDMCQCNSSQTECLCDTLSEYSRQCAHAGGRPQSWRTKELCDKTCPFNLEYSECSRPCQDTCSNQETSQVCAGHCVDGCFCPPGTVFNDIENNGCIPVDECPCIHNENIYQTGDLYNRTCQECMCANGQWNCSKLDCPGTCSLLGGSHIITYDGKAYTFHGNCYYVLSKDNNQTVLGRLVQCGTETCLTEVKLSVPGTTVTFLQTDSVLINGLETKLPVFNDELTVFRPSTFFIIAQTPSFQLMIQMVPIMQVYIIAGPEKKKTLNGLCGNFNDVQADDFTTESGQKESTPTTFANIWKATATCSDVNNSPQYPCSINMEKEKYAKKWCDILTDKYGVFSPCHAEVNPNNYKDRCVYDTCQCAKSEKCMCAALSSYAHVCAAKGVLLDDWRNSMCDMSSSDCPGNMQYSYSQTSCGSTCRSLSGIDYTCQVKHTPVDGCGCAEGTYLNDKGECVPDSSCPCYYNDQVVAPSVVISMDGATCTCTHGKLDCLGKKVEQTDCTAPMYYFNCSNAGPGAKGIECQRSCQAQSTNCISTQCQSGCMCPNGQLLDRNKVCVEKERCECFHNGLYYQPNATVQQDCNTCTCTKGKFICTTEKCPDTCTIFGEGHYMTFDGMIYAFSGDCEYMVAQDYCSNSFKGSFRVITENIPCGTTGTTCSKSIKIFLGNKEFLLKDEKITDIYNNATEIPYKIHTVGIYYIIEASNGLVLYWDKKTSLKIRLNPSFQGKVCGLCGNYDGNGKNDFVTRAGEEVVGPLEFGNSWRVFPTCSEAIIVSSPCDLRPHRHTWAVKHCNIINDEKVFGSCYNLVDPSKYYHICVQDTCACDSGGDCECFCTAVAAYAAACSEKGVCISWRTPTICPLFCDYYNSPEGCEWHYKSCGDPCIKTCANPLGQCSNLISTKVEGCYPTCPEDKPIFDEEKQICVEKCEGCFINGTEYKTGEEIPSDKPCTLCFCDESGREMCSPREGCCFYNGTKYGHYDVIYNVTDNMGMCYYAICINSTVIETSKPCSTTTTTTEVVHISTTTPETEQTTTPGTTTKATTTPEVITEPTTPHPGTEGTTPTSTPTTTTATTTTEVVHISTTTPEAEQTTTPGTITKATTTPEVITEPTTPHPGTEGTTPTSTPTTTTTEMVHISTTTPEAEQTTTPGTTTPGTTTKATTTPEVITEPTTPHPGTEGTTPSSTPTTTTTEMVHISSTTPETEQTPSPTTTTTVTTPEEKTTSMVTPTEPTTSAPISVSIGVITPSPLTGPQDKITTEQTSIAVTTTKATTTPKVITEPTTPYPETEGTTPTTTSTTTTREVTHVSTTTPETEQTTTTGTTTKATTTPEVITEPTTPHPGTEGTTPTSTPTTTTTTTTTEMVHISTTTPEEEQTTTPGTTTKATTTPEVITEPTTPHAETEGTTPSSTPTTTTTTTTREVTHVSTTTPETEQTTTPGTTTKATTTPEIITEPTTPHPGTEGTTPTTTTTEVVHISTTTPETEQTTTPGTTTKATTTPEVITEPTTPHPGTEGTTPTSTPTTTTTTTTTEVVHISTTTPEAEQTTTPGTTTKATTTPEVITEPTTPHPGTEGTTPTSTPTTTTTTTTTEVVHISTTTPETEQTTTTGTTTKATTTPEVITEPTTPHPGTEGTTPTSTPTTTTTTTKTEVVHISTTTPEAEQTTTPGTTTKATTTPEVITEPTTPHPETEGTTPSSAPTTTTTTTTREVTHVSTTIPETEQTTTTGTTTKATTTPEVITEPTTPHPGTEGTTPTSTPTTTTTTTEVVHISTTTPEAEQTTTPGTTTKATTTPEVITEPTTPHPETEGTTPTSTPTTTTTTTTREVTHVSTTTPETEQTTTTGTTTKATTTPEVITEPTTPHPGTEGTTPTSTPTTTTATTTTEVVHISTTTPEEEQTTTPGTTTKATTTPEVITEPTTPHPETEGTTPSSTPTTTTTTTTREVTHVSTTTPETEQTTTTGTITKATTTPEIITEPTTPHPGTEGTTPTTTTTEVVHISTTTPETEQTTTPGTTTKATTTPEVITEPTTPHPGTEGTTPTSTPTTTTTTTTTEVVHISTTTPEAEQTTTPGTTTKATTTPEVITEPTTPYPGTEGTTPTSTPTTTTTTTEVVHISTTTAEAEQTTTPGTTTKATTTPEVITEPTTPHPETEGTTPSSTPTTTTTTTTREVTHVSTTTPETEQTTTTGTTTKATTTPEVITEPTTPHPGTEGTTPTSTPTTTTATTTTEVVHISTTTPEAEQTTTPGTTTKATTTPEVMTEPTTPYPETEGTTPTSTPTTTTTTTKTEVVHISTTTPEAEQTTTPGTTTKATTTPEVITEPTTPHPGTEGTTPTSTPTTTTTTTTTTEVVHISTTTPEAEHTTTPGTTTKATTTPEVITEPTTPHPGTEGTTPTSTPTTTTTTTTTEVVHISTTTPEAEQTTTPGRTTKATTTPEVITEPTTPHPGTEGTTPTSTPTTTTTTTTTEVVHISTTTPEAEQTTTPGRTTKATTTPEVITTPTRPHPETTPTTTTSTSTGIPSTTVCVCVINGVHYEPGDTIFNMLHIGSGICLTMICSDICEFKNKTVLCPTTTSPPSTTPNYDCPEWEVNQNETFEICNCTMARCIEDNIIEIIPYECPPLKNITCSNGKKPVLVPDENYCCEEYACDCFCEGWGDPHYITFDGLFYSHQGNCTYVLMEEIRPKHNLKIYIDNVNCDPREFVSCPRALIVSYNNLVITLRNNNLMGAAKLEALLGHTSLKLPFAKNGLRVLGSGVNMILEIPQLGVVLTFGVTGFSVNLPFRHFGENTQGHCGTCNNNKNDDCMLPGGKLIDDCAVMADYWPAKDLYNPDCPQPPTVPPTATPTRKPCPANPVCELLKTDLFKECHPFVSPDNYFTGCQFDSCHVTNPAVVCTSLQTYASACSQFGVCLHWRNHTDLCTVNCEGNKVYKPCGPAEPPTCQDRPNEQSMNVTTEGCFCPDGTMLFNKDSGVCVDKCGCLDPSGQARELGEEFEHNCQDCVCEAATASVTCQPKQCSNSNPVICNEPGFIVANETDPTDECCTIFTCRCDSSLCPTVDGKCNIGYAPVLTVPEGKCCPELRCEPKKVCVHRNIEYEPGTTTPVVDCQECHCTWEVDPKSQLYKIRCGMVTCNKDCEPGYEYIEPLGEECCGKCVQTKCVIGHNGTRHVLQVGAEWVPRKPGCDRFMCANIGGEFISTNYKIQCPPFNIDDCQPGTVQLSADGCCKVCVEKERGCKVETTFNYISDNDCRSESRVQQTYCEGDCNSYSKYPELGSSSCSCCQASRTSNRVVTLNCANGVSVKHTYTYVEECSCNQTECHATKQSAATKS